MGRYAVGAMIAVLFLLYVFTVNAAPPPTVRALGLGGFIFGALFPLWAWWGDRHRDPVAI